MKSKHLTLVVVIGIIGVISYSCYTFSRAFRFPGDRGEIYDTWETTNDTFKVRMKAYYEVGIYMPGAFYTCESAPVGSNEWREFKAFRGDDAVPLNRLNQRFRFVDSKIAYFYTADDFLVTLNGGRDWSVWKPILPQSNGERVHWAILEANVEADGTGKAKLRNYDEQMKDAVLLDVVTKDYGQSWDMVQSTAKPNRPFNRSGDCMVFINLLSSNLG